MSEIPQYFIKSDKSKELQKLINEALYIISKLGIPIEGMTQRRLERMAMAFLAVANVNKINEWGKINNFHALRTREIIRYWNNYFDEQISESSYDDIRRKDLKLIVIAGIIIPSSANPNYARNDGTRSFALNPNFANLIKNFGSDNCEEEAKVFLSNQVTLKQQLSSQRKISLIPVKFPSGKILNFSPGKHNELQKAIIEKFLPRYGYGAEILYVGDTAKKFLHLEKTKLRELNFFELSDGELPDIVAYSANKNWLYLIEAVHSSGIISNVRLLEFKKLTEKCKADIIFVTAFLDHHTFRKFAVDIAWETEVWIADAPDHIIHFNGEKFLGPYPQITNT